MTPDPIERFQASRADDDGLRLQAQGSGGRHDLLFSRAQAVALAAEFARITERRSRNYRGGPK